MNAEHLSDRQLKIPDGSPEPLAQLLTRAQQGLTSSPGLDTVRWLHDSLAFLTEFFTAFSIGALKTVGPYSSALEQLLQSAPSLDRSERLLSQAFTDWRAHPHHPAYESLREAFFLSSRLQSSRTAPRRHTRWLGVEGRAVEGLEQLSRWSRRLDLLVSGQDDQAAAEQIRLYLPLLWIWTDALDGFFRDWSLRLTSEVEGGKLKISGTANRDDIHLQLMSTHPIQSLKANFVADGSGRVKLDGFSAPMNGSPAPAVTASPPQAAGPVADAAPPRPPVMEVIDSALPAIGAALDEPALSSAPVSPLEAAPQLPEPDTLSALELPGPDSLPVLEAEPELLAPDSLPALEAEPELLAPDSLPALEAEPELLAPDSLPALEAEPELLAPDSLPALEAEPELLAPDSLPALEAEPELLAPDSLPALEAEPELLAPDSLPALEAEPELLAPDSLPALEAEPELLAPDSLPALETEAPPQAEALSSFSLDLSESQAPEPTPDLSVFQVDLSTPDADIPPAVEATVEVPAFQVEPTVELPPEPQTAPSTPWADLISSSNQPSSDAVLPETEDEDSDSDAPLPEFALTAPTREELPDFSGDFSAGFSDDQGFGASLIDFGSTEPAESPDLSAPSPTSDALGSPAEPPLAEPEPVALPPEPPLFEPESVALTQEPPPAEPEPVALPSEPPLFEPESVALTQEPSPIEPEPSPLEPMALPSEPPLFEPAAVALTQEPSPAEPEPVASPPEPSLLEPEPVALTAEPSPAEPEPWALPPEPSSVEPEPVALTPEPPLAEPEPMALPPEPSPVEPEPVALPPEPSPVEPEPEPSEPAPPVFEPLVVAPESHLVALEPGPAFSLTPAESGADFPGSGTVPETPDFSAAIASSVPGFPSPAAELPDFSSPGASAGLPDFGGEMAPPGGGTLDVPGQGVVGGTPEFSPPAPSAPDFSAAPEPSAPPPVLSGFEPPAPVTPANPAMAMGGQAEDILEDDFEFSSEAGPARPNWKGWAVSERENVQQACETAVGATVGKIPPAFAGPLNQALRSDVNKFQIVLGPACGKSHLAHDLCVTETQGAFGPCLLVEWSPTHSGEVDGQELLSIYFQLREEVRVRGSQVHLPEPEAVASLAMAAASDGFGSAFQRLLGQLAVLNRGGLTLLLDEPPEGIRQNLPSTLPGKLRVISLVTAMNSGPELGARVELQGAWQQAAVELFGPVASEVTSDPAANLLRVGLYVQLRNLGGTPPTNLADIGKAVLTSPGIDQDLLACLALEQRPVSLDDLDQWYLDSSSVAACVRSFPSLFCLRSSRLSPQLGLSHHSIEAAVIASLSDAYHRAANRLLGWVVAQLERTSADKYGGLQVREIVLRNFYRLYHHARNTGSREIMEWVARNKDLQRNRITLSTHLEKPASRWELEKLLLLLADTLRTLVDTGSCDDLRDELAWALSYLGLNRLHLGLTSQAREDVLEAVSLFTTLVDQEKQHEFRPALATTLYRASRIASALGLSQEAREQVERAVADLVELVEDRGRADLQSRLGVTLALRGSLRVESSDIAGAMKDLQRASSLLASSPEEKQRENKASQIGIHLDLSSIYLKARDLDNAIKESTKAVQLATQAVEEMQMEELQPLLASCHTTRARCILELNETDRAQRDISKSITLRNLAVDEGRLDQRFELSKEYLLRAQIDRGRGMTDDASRDLGRAIEILEQLDHEGRKDASRQLLLCLVERSDLALATGDSARSIGDLKKAFTVSQADTSGSAESAQARVAVLDGLLRAYLRAGDSEQALGVSTELLTHYQAGQDWESFARVQLVRGDAFERQANLPAAAESFTQAVNLLSKLLEQGQTDERLALVAEAYLGAGSVELRLDHADRAAEQIKRSLDIFGHLFQQRGMKTALPKMLKAYSLFASVHLNKGKTQDAMVLLKSGFDILGYLEKEGGASNMEGFELRKAELYRQRARALFAQGEATSALHDSEEAMRNFLLDRQKNQTGPWKDELARTWTLRSSIFFVLKDFTQAESSAQEAIAHFEEQVRAGRFQYFDDLMKALTTRAENAGKAGKIDRVLEEYGRMLGFASAAGQAGAAVNVDLESAKILERRARVYRDQSLFNEAYSDYDKVIGLYRRLLSERGRNDLAIDLVRVHLERGDMLSGAGHAEHAVGDYSQAVDLAKALVGQGHLESAPLLAKGLQRRADCYRLTGKPREALQDLEGAVGFQMQMAQQRQDPELMGSLARAFLSQGQLLAGFQQLPQAAASLDSAIGIFTTLVEQQHQRQYSADMAQALIQRVSLTNDKTDPAMRQVLIRAVDLVTAQAREGKPVARDFPIDCLRAVVDLLTREDFDTVGDLIDAVLRLVELVVADGKSSQDFVKLTDLLLAASAGLIDDRRTARRPHFLALACVSCNREIQMFGKNSLPRLVYCLYELGQALERSKPPTVLNYIGSSFALLGELASQQQNNEDFTRELKMMVTTWRSLPPQVPALANVSRHMLSQLLRLT